MHRYPFLLVDRVLEWEYGKYAVGYKCVTVNDNFFPGHFPQRAIMPGEATLRPFRHVYQAWSIKPSPPTFPFDSAWVVHIVCLRPACSAAVFCPDNVVCIRLPAT